MVLCFVFTFWDQFLEGGGDFRHFVIYIYEYCHKFPVFVNLFFAKERILHLENHHNCQQYERVLKTFYFLNENLNVTKFG